MSQVISLIAAVILLVTTIASAVGGLPWWVVLIAVLLFLSWVASTSVSNAGRVSSKA